MKHVIKPNLFIPGMPKCGSFYLYDLLAQHPKISMSKTKEPAFFSNENYIKTYNEYFDHNTGYEYYGEATVEYLIRPNSLQEIKREIENPKFLILLRDPVKRAVSHYHHRKNVDPRNLTKLIRNENGGYPLNYSKYKRHLQYFFDLFPTTSCKIIISEDLFANPSKIMNDIFNFLELEMIPLNFQSANENKGNTVKSRKLSYYSNKISRNDTLKRKFKFLKPLLKKLQFYINNLNSSNKERGISASHLAYFENNLREDKAFIQELLNRPDLWNN